MKSARVNEIDLVCEVLSLERYEGCHEGINHSASRYSRESEENDTRMRWLVLGCKEVSVPCDDDKPLPTGISKDNRILLRSQSHLYNTSG
jgi:hypothetical protein